MSSFGKVMCRINDREGVNWGNGGTAGDGKPRGDRESEEEWDRGGARNQMHNLLENTEKKLKAYLCLLKLIA